MAGAEEFTALIESVGRRVFVTDDLLDLGKLDQPNEIYVLQMLSASTAAGGRGGGMGDRRVVNVYHFSCGQGECKRVGAPKYARCQTELFSRFLVIRYGQIQEDDTDS